MKQRVGLYGGCFVLLSLFLCVFGLGGLGGNAVPQGLDQETWSATDPGVNLEHIFHGQINRRGRPTGFHSRPGGQDPDDAGIVAVLQGPNSRGVYMARVWVRQRKNTKMSSFYPDSLGRPDVVSAILYAYKHGNRMGGGKFRGPSGRGFTIEGYVLDDGRINTAYPIYQADPPAGGGRPRPHP